MVIVGNWGKSPYC